MGLKMGCMFKYDK